MVGDLNEILIIEQFNLHYARSLGGLNTVSIQRINNYPIIQNFQCFQQKLSKVPGQYLKGLNDLKEISVVMIAKLSKNFGCSRRIFYFI